MKIEDYEEYIDELRLHGTRELAEEIYQLQQIIQQLKIQISAREEVCNRLEDNWNKLKEYLKGFDIEHLNEIMEHNLANTLENILDKMKEMEKSDSNE